MDGWDFHFDFIAGVGIVCGMGFLDWLMTGRMRQVFFTLGTLCLLNLCIFTGDIARMKFARLYSCMYLKTQ